MRRADIASGTLFWMLAIAPLWGQSLKPLEWRADQQPQESPCNTDDIAFATAPEQIALERSYFVPQLAVTDVHHAPPLSATLCTSINATAFNGARALLISRPSLIDDGMSYALIQPKGSRSARLIQVADGGHLVGSSREDWHNFAAMNAMLQTSRVKSVQNIDWLAICLAYLTLLGDAPSLMDQHFEPEPGETFKSYTVPGLLSELPQLRKKNQLPTVKCEVSGMLTSCTVDFYYRTQPVALLEHASFKFILEGDQLSLRQVAISDFEKLGHQKRH